MTTQEERNAQEGLAVAAIRKELLESNIDAAKVIEREQMIPPQAVASIVNTVFDSFVSEHKYLNAIELARSYDLPIDKINDTIYMEFRHIITTGDIEKAIDWALVNHLPDYEITRAAIRGIESAILNKNVALALEIKHKYSISENQIGNIWQKGYDEAVKDEKYFEAALLSREFGMSARKTAITASRAFRKAMEHKDYEMMVRVEDEFRIFNDSGFTHIGDEDGRSLIRATEDFIRQQIRSADFQQVVELIHGLGVLIKEIANHTLRDLVVFTYNLAKEIHQLLFEENRYDNAVWFKSELNLLESTTPDKILREIFNQAVDYHNKYLKNGNISLAIKVKKDYDLLGTLSNADSIVAVQNAVIVELTRLIESGETKLGNSIINEYNIPQPEIEKVVSDAVINSLTSGSYERAVDIVSKFHVQTDQFEIKAAAQSAFEQCRRSGYQETAANIGLIFDIDSPEVRDAARLVWEDLMRRKEYKKAGVLRKKHKLTKKYTDSVARDEYNTLIDQGNIDVAQKIREEYRFNVGILSWLIEFIKKLFSIFLGSDESEEQQVRINDDKNESSDVEEKQVDAVKQAQ